MGLTKLSNEVFDKARKEEKDKLEQNNMKRGSFQRKYEDINYSALQKNSLKFVRIVGLPIELREQHDPYYSPKIVYLSWIRDDRDNLMRIVWPNKQENYNWPLYKIMYKVMSYTYNRESGSRDYHYIKRCPKLFYRINKNINIRLDQLDENGNLKKEVLNKLYPYESGWTPTQYVMMNVIDRAHMDWHKENKHTLVLSKKMSRKMSNSGQEIISYEPGVPYRVYSSVMSDEIAGTYHHFINYDVVIKKLENDPYYKVFHPENEKQYINPQFNSKDEFLEQYPFYDQEMHLRPLTEEEESWKRYNFDKIYKTTSYQKIRNRLGNLIKEYDKEFNESIYDEIDYLANKEREKYEELENNDQKEVEDNIDISQKALSENNKENKSIENSSSIPIRERNVKEPSDELEFDLSQFNTAEFKGLDKLSDENKKLIVGYDPEADTFIYNSEEIYRCTNAKEEENPCTMLSPSSFNYCPKCGVKF